MCCPTNLQMPFRELSGLIKSKTNCPGPHVLAGRGTVVCRRKSLELITREACCRFRGETASQRDGAEIKERAGTKTDGQTERDKQTKMFPLLSQDSQPETIADRRRQKQSMALRWRPKEEEKSRSLWAKCAQAGFKTPSAWRGSHFHQVPPH